MAVDTIVRRRAETITNHIIDWTKSAPLPPIHSRQRLGKTNSLGMNAERTPLLDPEFSAPPQRKRSHTHHHGVNRGAHPMLTRTHAVIQEDNTNE